MFIVSMLGAAWILDAPCGAAPPIGAFLFEEVMMEKFYRFQKFEAKAGTNRTFNAILSTEYPVKRPDGKEVLSHDPGAIDLSRSPLPLLCAHNDRSLPVGIVENIRIENGQLVGTIRLSENQEAIRKDIADKILNNLSVGYQVQRRQRIPGGYRVTKWTPFEVSLVAAGADPHAIIKRSFQTLSKGKTMDYNDLLKAKKRAVEKLAELQKDENLTPEKFEEIEREMDDLDQRLAVADRLRDANEDLKTRGTGFKPEIHEKKERDITFEGGPALDKSYRGMFGDYDTDDEEIERFRASMVSGTPSAGGFSVPDPLAAKWLDASLPDEIVRSRATVWPMTSATRKVPGWDGADMSSGEYFGGFAMEFLSEEGEGTKQTGKLRLIELAAKKGAIFVDISNELREDGQGFESQLEMAIKKSIGLGMDHYFITGTGAGQPLGMLNDPAIVSVAKESGQSADTLVIDNLSKMYARHYAPQRAVWLANATTVPQMLTLTISVGTGGAYIPMMKETGGGFSLFGRPVIFSQSMPVLGDANDIVLVDPSQYAIGLRKDVRLEKSNIPGWTTDLMSYRAIVRFDGQGTWNAAITPRNGDTLSWVVGLAERAA